MLNVSLIRVFGSLICKTAWNISQAAMHQCVWLCVLLFFLRVSDNGLFKRVEITFLLQYLTYCHINEARHVCTDSSERQDPSSVYKKGRPDRYISKQSASRAV